MIAGHKLALVWILVSLQWTDRAVAVTPIAKPPWLHLAGHSLLDSDAGGVPLKPMPDLQACVDRTVKRMGVTPNLRQHFSIFLANLSSQGGDIPYAQYNEDKSMYGASIVKAAVLLSAHQLQQDLRQAVESAVNKSLSPSVSLKTAGVRLGIATDGNTLAQMFTLGGGGNTDTHTDAKLEFSEAFKSDLTRMIRYSDNAKASSVISRIGFNFIASVLWQRHLFDPAHGGGLWLGRAYGRDLEPWHRDPVNSLSHSANARALGLLFVQLSRGILISKGASESMLSYFANSSFHIKSIKAFEDAGFQVNTDNHTDPAHRVTIYRKSGTMDGISHDATLITRDACLNTKCEQRIPLRYVAVVMTDHPKLAHQLGNTFLPLDQCVLDQTQKPL